MKNIIIRINLYLILMLTLYSNVFAQDRGNALIINGTLEHYIPYGRTFQHEGFYKYPVAPGLSVLYQYQLSPKYFLSSGIVYQMGRVATYINVPNRFRFGEMSVPLILKRVLTEDEHKELSMSVGIFYGKMIHLNWEAYGSGGWQDVAREYNEHYSEKNIFADLFFSLGITIPVNNGTKFGIEPYLKYRVKDNWMGYDRSEMHLGLMINYKFNLKSRNEKI